MVAQRMASHSSPIKFDRAAQLCYVNGLTGCRKTLWFEGYGLQPVHKGSKNNGFSP
jgi:hypothetical protein